jgi:hypothetical protein
VVLDHFLWDQWDLPLMGHQEAMDFCLDFLVQASLVPKDNCHHQGLNRNKVTPEKTSNLKILVGLYRTWPIEDSSLKKVLVIPPNTVQGQGPQKM